MEGERMAQRFLIEVEHEASPRACTEAVKVFLRTGSHFLTHADWGCKDGEHKAWIVVDVDSRDEARNIVPAQFRAQAKIVMLNTFTMTEAEMVQAHLGR
jgi:hypothetical protein